MIGARAQVAQRHVGRQEALEQALALGKCRQPFHVIGVVHVLLLRVQANEAVGGCHGLFVIEIAVVSINEFELGLFGIGTEWIARLQKLEILDRKIEIAALDVFLGCVIELSLALVGRYVVVLADAEPRATREVQGEQ